LLDFHEKSIRFTHIAAKVMGIMELCSTIKMLDRNNEGTISEKEQT